MLISLIFATKRPSSQFDMEKLTYKRKISKMLLRESQLGMKRKVLLSQKQEKEWLIMKQDMQWLDGSLKEGIL